MVLRTVLAFYGPCEAVRHVFGGLEHVVQVMYLHKHDADGTPYGIDFINASITHAVRGCRKPVLAIFDYESAYVLPTCADFCQVCSRQTFPCVRQLSTTLPTMENATRIPNTCEHLAQIGSPPAILSIEAAEHLSAIVENAVGVESVMTHSESAMDLLARATHHTADTVVTVVDNDTDLVSMPTAVLTAA